MDSTGKHEPLLGVAVVLTAALALLHPGLAGPALRGAFVLAAGLLLALHLHLSERPTGPGLLLGLAGAGVLGVALLQCLPLPVGLVESLAPTSAALHGLDSEGAPKLSLEPATSLRCALLGAAYLALFAAARPRQGEPLALALSLGGGALALAALSKLALSGTTTQWAYRARWPLENPNHLCSALALCLSVGLGVVLSPTDPRRRAAAGCAAALCVVGIVATRSRAGAVAAVGAVGGTLLLAGGGGRRRLWSGGLALLVVGLGVLISDPEPLRARFSEEAPTRVGVSLGSRPVSWRMALKLVEDAPLVGAGLGTFDAASPALVDASEQRWTRPADAHSEPLELAAGVGLPAAGAALLLLGVALLGGVRDLRRSEAGRERALRAGFLGGGLGVLAHACVDFPLQSPGVAALFAIALGVALGPGGGGTSSPWRRRLGPALGVALALAGGLLWLQGRREAAARAASEAIAKVRAELRPLQAERQLPFLEAAAGPGARGEVYAWLAQGLLYRPQGGARAALLAAREAARRAPAEGRFQLQVAALILLANPRAKPDQLAEAEARLRLGVERAPTYPGVLKQGALVAMELVIRSGRDELLQLARTCLVRLIEQRPDQLRWARHAVRRAAPRLGRGAAWLEGELPDHL